MSNPITLEALLSDEMKPSSIGIIATILLCRFIIPITAIRGSGSSERRLVSLPQEEARIHGIFQKHGRLAEYISIPKGSAPLPANIFSEETTSSSATQIPLRLGFSMRRRVSHILASILTMCLLGSMVYRWKFMDPNDRTGAVVLMISLVAYFMEAANSSTARYLRNSLTPDEVDQYLDSIRAVIPRVIWDIECFHYRTVRRVDYSSSSSNDEDGNDRNVPHVREETEKIVTHRASAEYSFDKYVDMEESKQCFRLLSLLRLDRRLSHDTLSMFYYSNDLSCKDETDTRSLSRILMGGGYDNIDNDPTQELRSLPKQFTKITLDKLLLFVNTEAYYDYVDQESRFRYLHQNRDVHYTFSSRLQMDGYLPKILVVNHSLGGAGTGLFKNLWYWVFTCFGLTVPYRIWFSQHCSYTSVTITKEVKGRMFPSQ